ncbi:MBL fold metallo-hydrolase [Muricoccus radiodurans]|uniref:MBL fold metallo-hydrolase n=1 Tax=Muricoccus radiodurans TaxID=2231721 RepID=UPI003CE7540E
MKVTVLGCGGSGGVPLIGGEDGRGDWGACDPATVQNRRTRSSILLQGSDGATILVDTGPDLRAQLLTAGVRRVDAILLTHAHADHIMGLDEVRQLNRIMGRALPIYATQDTLNTVTHRFDYAFRPETQGFFRPALLARPVEPGQVVDMAGLPVRIFSQDHRVMETLGLRVGGFGYSTDVVTMPDAGFAALEGVRTWMVGCFQRRPHPVHADVATVERWARRLRPNRTVLTHMGPDLDWGWMRTWLPAGLEPAHDGMVLEVQR